VTGWSYLKYSYACGLMAAADPLMLDAIDSVLEGVQPVDVPNNIAEVSFDTLYGLRDGSHLEMMRLAQGWSVPPPPRDEGQRRSKAAVEDAPAQDDMDVDAALPAKDQTPAPPPPRDEGQRRSKAAVEDAPAQDDMDVDAALPAKDQTPAPPPPRDEGQRRSKAAVEDAPAQDDMDVDAALPAKDQTPAPLPLQKPRRTTPPANPSGGVAGPGSRPIRYPCDCTKAGRVA